MSTRLPRVRHGARAPGGDQADAPRDRRRLRSARALPPRGALGRAAQPPARRDRDRRRRGALPSDAGRGEHGTPYIVLEYVDGETLKDVIRREGPLEIPQALAYAIEIARALGRRARAPDRAPRRQAAERPDQRGRRRQDHRLRDRAHAHRGGPDDGRPRARHDRLRLARAGARPAGDRAVGPLLARRRAVRDADRRRCRSTASRRSRWR